MRHTAFLAAGIGLLFVQANLFRLLRLLFSLLSSVLEVFHLHQGDVSVAGFVPSLVLPLILFLGVQEYSLARGAGVAFALGYVSDVLGATPVGLYTFTFVLLFVLARSLGVRLAAQATWMQVLLVTGFSLTESIIILVLLAIFGRDTWVPKALYPLSLPHALATALVSPLVFRLARRLHGATVPVARGPQGGAT
jgi:rod shape-determining protein MreD